MYHILMTGHDNVYKSAFGYFFTASSVLLVCFVAIVMLFKLVSLGHDSVCLFITCSVLMYVYLIIYFCINKENNSG